MIGPPNIASRPTVPPIAIAAASPTARVSVATAMITNIRKKRQHQLPEERLPLRAGRQRRADVGDVAERGAQQRRSRERAGELRAPSSASARGHGKWRVSAKAKVTAGLKWAPEMWPTA